MALFNCPECGKQISVNAKNCIHCGFPIPQQRCTQCGHEYNAYLEACPQCGFNPKKAAEKEAEAEAQRIRFQEAKEEKRRKREAEEAKDALLRAEKRKAWWQNNKLKVIVAIITIFVLVIGVIVYHQIAEKKRFQLALAEAKAYIASGDSCVAIYHFDEAQNFYNKAKHTEAAQEVRNEITKKESALRNAQNNADQEYNEALRRLKVFLDADDGEFNDLSNACLDKMIQIYPDRQETKYFQQLRKK